MEGIAQNDNALSFDQPQSEEHYIFCKKCGMKKTGLAHSCFVTIQYIMNKQTKKINELESRLLEMEQKIKALQESQLK